MRGWGWRVRGQGLGKRGLKGWGWRREGGVGGSERVGFGEERGLKGWGRRLEKRG